MVLARVELLVAVSALTIEYTLFMIPYAIAQVLLLAVFKVISYSEKGSNCRKKEDTYANFVDYLDECERGKPQNDTCTFVSTFLYK